MKILLVIDGSSYSEHTFLGGITLEPVDNSELLRNKVGNLYFAISCRILTEGYLFLPTLA
jgi:hypothetical protein